MIEDWSIWYVHNFMKMPQLNRKYPSGAAKTRKKQGYIHVSCQVAEMAWVLWVLDFSTDISSILRGLNLPYAWGHRLFEAWPVNAWFKVDLVDVKFLASSQPV